MKTLYKNQLLSLLIMATVLLASCEKTINVNVPPYAHKLVVNCNTMTGDELFISVSKSAQIKDRKNHPDLVINDAVVKLYIDGAYAETLNYDSAQGYQSGHYTHAGGVYTIKVSAAGYDDVAATVTAPPAVAITGITRVPYARKDQDGNEQDALTLTFSDPPVAGDYYIIKVNGIMDSTFYYNSNFCVNSPDAGVETNASDLVDANTCLDNNGIFLRDDLFNGQRKELKLYVQSMVIQPQYNGVDSVYASIELLHVTEAYFRYLKSNKVADESNGNPFSEPVNVYSNITNGLGIFAIVSRDGMQVK